MDFSFIQLICIFHSLKELSIIYLYSILVFIVSAVVSYFFYFYKEKTKDRNHWVLWGLRTLVFFVLGLLLLNPLLTKSEITIMKPKLNVLVDNSSSIQNLNGVEEVKSIIETFDNSNDLKEKFDVSFFSFGNDIEVLDSLSFHKSQTNIYKNLEQVDELIKDKGAIILISDGNQSLGNDFSFYKSTHKNAIHSIVVGDTTKYEDLSIKQVNVNKYSYLKNTFPVEVLVNYDGNSAIKTQVVIEKDKKIIFKKELLLSKEKSSVFINTQFTSTHKGLHKYRVYIKPFIQEKNQLNNAKNFQLEVIDEQTKVLMLSSFHHPDIGVLKRSIEVNPQRKVEIDIGLSKENKLKDYQLIILYQPDVSFVKVFEEIIKEKHPFLLITGTKTNWSVLNNYTQLGVAKNIINQSEKYFPILNESYLSFVQEDIGFNDFPPLQDVYGNVTVNIPHQVLLTQAINEIRLDFPLLATGEIENHKVAYLFGEGIWKWRSSYFKMNNSFEEFDSFIGSIIQLSASKKIRKRLEVSVKNQFNSHEEIEFNAVYLDENYNIDERGSLVLEVKNKMTNEVKEQPFSLDKSFFKTEISNLTPGEYSYKVSVDNHSLMQTGSFTITDFDIEKQFVNSNPEKLRNLATNNNGDLYNLSNIQNLIDDIVDKEEYTPIQKSKEINSPFINYKLLMAILICLATLEWGLRKYWGKI